MFNTANGAPSGNPLVPGCAGTVYDKIFEWIPILVKDGALPLHRLDELIVHVDAMGGLESISAAFTAIDIDPATILQMIDYVKCKSADYPHRDYVLLAKATKQLLTSPTSPFCMRSESKVTDSDLRKHGLPAPTVHTGTMGELSLRSKAATRAAQIVRQFQLATFDGARDALKYLEWKYSVLDACDLSDTEWSVRLEIVLHCLSPLTCSDVRLNSAADFAAHDWDRQELFTIIWKYLDSCFKNLRSIRHIENNYISCRMTDVETLSGFCSRFQRSARLYERARDCHLSDSDKVIAFGNALTPKYSMLLRFIEATCSDTISFLEYSQKLLYLSDLGTNPSTPSGPSHTSAIADVAALTAKRPRVNDSGARGGPTGRGLGCYRCCEGNHTAVTCPNPLKDAASRCARCGSRKHDIGKCRSKPSRPCRRCGGDHFESICPNDLKGPQTTTHSTGVSMLEVSDFASMNTLLTRVEPVQVDASVIDVDCSTLSIEIVDPTPPMIDVRIGKTLFAGLVDSGAGASVIHPDLVMQLFKAREITKDDVIRIDPPIRIRFGNGISGTTDMALKTNSQIGVNTNRYTCYFLIYSKITPHLILGRPLLKAIGFMNKDRLHKQIPPINDVVNCNVSETTSTSDAFRFTCKSHMMKIYS